MGRPREFDADLALDAALVVFWRGGYAATSLDDLTAAMGLSRSSFYGAFKSKHAVLLAALGRYVDDVFARLQAIVASSAGPAAAVRSIVAALAMPPRAEAGCLLVNSITELAPGDADVAALARMQVERVTALIKATLMSAGWPAESAEGLAGALLSCAFGATTLRKAGLPAEIVAGLLAQMDCILDAAPGPGNATQASGRSRSASVPAPG